LKTLCNGVIDYFANDINTCELDELHGLAKNLQEERDAAAKERAAHQLNKKQAEDAVRVRKERVEYQMGFRSAGKGITLDSELNDSSFVLNKAPEILDGLAALGKPTGSKCESS
jgi:hypothetical protein